MFTILCMLLVIIGAVNWFSVGVFNFNIVNWIFTAQYYVGARVIYGLVGVAGLWLVAYLIYNKFSSKKLNTIEHGIKESMDKHNDLAHPTVNIEAGNIEAPTLDEKSKNAKNSSKDKFEEFD
ncbi:MAG: DUF378 domain-containing protein [Clostridia bacterium]